jgi:phosphoribosylformylglycinamidine (FGAM) synthase-like enzyme/phosphoribosylformylglycinamidine (FGAM) synthase-like amidotransferase family enzyme
MILFFKTHGASIVAVAGDSFFSETDIAKLVWLLGGAELLATERVEVVLVGPRREMITPWSTNAVEITRIMGIQGVERIEEFRVVDSPQAAYDPMLQRIYEGIDQEVFTIRKMPEPIVPVEDIAAYNRSEGLALSPEEVDYLNGVSQKLGRPLTDSEVFGFSQVNSEHCRHKIFNGLFVIDGVEQPATLFQLIKRTSELNPNQLVSAYKDNVAFSRGPAMEQFAPETGDRPSFYKTKNIDTVLSLKAETHNFPTTVEPFNGASTGTGGEIRDRLGGGKASLPLAGTAVYMTAYPRPDGGRPWEQALPPRNWLYQTPEQILIKASNGASDFGNKFGQPIICGSVLTFEHTENGKQYAYDKVIMLAGGVGFAKESDALKGTVAAGEAVVVLGGDNYRIGMGGGAVSSVDTGEYTSGIELNAVQRANPEMQKRVANVIRTLAESEHNPIVSIHDHGAGGHLNCLSELVETTGGAIDMDRLPVGDPTLSAKEIIGNESQERMGLILKEIDLEEVRRIADRERAPMYEVGRTTGDMQFVFRQADGQCPLDMQLSDFFGKPPRTVMSDETVRETFHAPEYEVDRLPEYLEKVLQLEAVACKDWLTNKVDRSVSGKIARQQCQGEIQLPLSDLGAVALDYRGQAGVATSIGHAPQAALIDPAAGSALAIAEALTNLVFAPLKEQLSSVSLSANWMWPCKNSGEDARLYRAVEACSRFACELGINIPTGKDSLSMTQKYGEEKVYAPGTVIISAGAEVSDVRKIVSPVVVNGGDDTLLIDEIFELSGINPELWRHNSEICRHNLEECRHNSEIWRHNSEECRQNLEECRQNAEEWRENSQECRENPQDSRENLEFCRENAEISRENLEDSPEILKICWGRASHALYYVDFSKDKLKLGGSAFAQSLNAVGQEAPTVRDAAYFRTAFNTVQQMVADGLLLAGHDISAGGMITTLLEMCFGNTTGGLSIDLLGVGGASNFVERLFAENPGVVIQAANNQEVERRLIENKIRFAAIGWPVAERELRIQGIAKPLDINALRDLWYRPSYLLERRQAGEVCAQLRYENYKQQPLQIQFPAAFSGVLGQYGLTIDRQNRPSGIRAAIIREKGTNGDREMAYSLYLAGFDVKDVHMTDLASGRETLEDVNFIVFCGGFSNSDVLGSAKGWAGAFLYNELSKKALERFYARPDTLSLGVCNGCQLMVELNLLCPKHAERPAMLHNDSHKLESAFLSVEVPQNQSVLLQSLAGAKLGIWVNHGEGKFHLPRPEKDYSVVLKYVYDAYPGNPNGSDYAVAGICSEDGRHLAMMPHLERSIFPWQWAYYPKNRAADEIAPWLEAFVNARLWIKTQKGL